MSNSKGFTVGQLLAVGLFPLILIGAGTGVVFGVQAWSFSQQVFVGDWALLLFVLLFLETFGGTIAAGLFSLVFGIGIPAGVGSPVTVLEILACGVATGFAFGQGFWSLLRWSFSALSLTEPIPSILLTFLLLAPVCLFVVFCAATVINIILSVVLDFIPGRKRG